MFFSLEVLKEWTVERADNDKRSKDGDKKGGTTQNYTIALR